MSGREKKIKNLQTDQSLTVRWLFFSFSNANFEKINLFVVLLISSYPPDEEEGGKSIQIIWFI